MFAIERAAHDFLATLMLERLFERFPNIRVASVENGSEFLAPLFRKLRTTTRRMPGYFSEDPVVTFRRHIWINPFWEDDVNEIVDFMGDDRVIFGSDWPHIEGMPEPTDWVTELQKLDSDSVAKIMGGNVSELNERRPRGNDRGRRRRRDGGSRRPSPPNRTPRHRHFGATGDLAARELLPGLLHLSMSGMMPEFRIVGSSLSELSDEEFRHLARHACDKFATGKISLLEWAKFEQAADASAPPPPDPRPWPTAVARRRTRSAGSAPAALPEHPAGGGRR